MVGIQNLVENGVPLTDPNIIQWVVEERVQENEYDEKKNPTYKPVNPENANLVIDIIKFLEGKGVKGTNADLDFVKKGYTDLEDCVREGKIFINCCKKLERDGQDLDGHYRYEIGRTKDHINAYNNYYKVKCHIEKLLCAKSEDVTPVKRERDPEEERSEPSDRVAKK